MIGKTFSIDQTDYRRTTASSLWRCANIGVALRSVNGRSFAEQEKPLAAGGLSTGD
jgi:hypothetical protein